MQRKAQLGLTIAGALSLGLACASCLVTKELDFEANQSLLTVRLSRPASPSPVSAASPGDCATGQIELVASYYYEDVEAPLSVMPLVNGQLIQNVPFIARANPDGTPFHLIQEPVCVFKRDLMLPCNRVELFVSADPSQLANADRARSNPQVVKQTWLLLGGSEDSPTGAAKPYVSFNDCYTPDGGI